MSLLECICCPKHSYRTAVISDDLRISSAETYGCLIGRACRLACYMRQKFYAFSGHSKVGLLQPDRVVAFWSESCPEAVSGILGILSVPAVYMPMRLDSNGTTDFEQRLKNYGVRIALIHHSCLQSFICRGWSNTHVTMETSMLELGFICAIFDRTSLLLPSLTSLIHHHCTSTEKCNNCSIIKFHPPQFSVPLTDSYYSDISQCNVCRGQCAINSNDDASNCAINNSQSPIDDKWNFSPSHPSSLAYVMHTSGSTGIPKPVRVPHCCIVPNIIDLTQRFSLCPDDCVFNAAPLTFDPSIIEMLLALFNGASLLTVTDQIKRSPWKLSDVLLIRNQVTVLQLTPSLFYHLPLRDVVTRLLGDQSCVKVLAFGGERCPSLRLLAQYKSISNLTLIFNIYGITEVSSWSTCYKVTERDLQSVRDGARGKEGEGSREDVPLGEAMLGTKIEVRDSQVENGLGDIYLGGGYRVCLLGDEISPTPSCMRCTGDKGWVGEDGQVYFAGRKDRQIKRWGHRISLDHIEKSIMSHEGVSSCVVTTVSEHTTLCHLLPHFKRDHSELPRLVAFIVPTQQSMASPLNQSSVFSGHSLYSAQQTKDRDSTMTDLVQLLPSHMVPDVIIYVHYLPCNQHGKVDVKRLLQFDHDSSLYLHPLPSPSSSVNVTSEKTLFCDVHAIKNELLSLLTCFTRFTNWPSHLTLLDLGATSFDIVRIADAMATRLIVCRHIPSLIDVLLTQTLSEISEFLWAELSSNGGSGDDVCVAERDVGRKEEQHRKRARREVTLKGPPSKQVLVHCESVSIQTWRRGQYLYNGRLCFATFTADGPTTNCIVRMMVKWRYNTGRCVDASPLVVKKGLKPLVVFIGSHSGVFVSLCASSGECLWKVQLSDRIESSACLSPSTSCVIVGCYDGFVYCLKADSGDIHWSIKLSSEPIKSSPCVDISHGIVWVGSHDHHLYAINTEMGNIVHKLFLGGGSCFSSPCIDTDRGLVYAANLQGRLTAVDMSDVCIVWSYQCGSKPVFSSPSLLPNGDVVLGSVDGSVYIIDSSGNMVRRLETEQPVFSTCSVVLVSNSDNQTQMNATPGLNVKDEGVIEEVDRERVRIFCGSHDKCVYCWDVKEGKEVWVTALDSEIYATPVACHQTSQIEIESSIKASISSHETVKSRNNIENIKPVNFPVSTSPNLHYICVCTTSGALYLLDIHTGIKQATLKLPGQIFSSPVVVDGHILVGCRDDNIYCVEYLM